MASIKACDEDKATMKQANELDYYLYCHLPVCINVTLRYARFGHG